VTLSCPLWHWSAPSARNTGAGTASTPHRRGLITYRRPDPFVAVEVVRRWLVSHERITSGDYAMLTGLTPTRRAQGTGSSPVKHAMFEVYYEREPAGAASLSWCV
jgi:hypothetical protein